MNRKNLSFLFFIFDLFRNVIFFLRLPCQPSYNLSFRIYTQHTGNRFFAVKHQNRAIFLAVSLLCPALRFLLLVRPDGLPGLVQFYRVKVGGLRFCLGVLMQRGFQFGRIFLLLPVQLLQVGF